MSIEVSMFENIGHSPVWDILPMAAMEMQQNGFQGPRNYGPSWNDPVLVAGIDSKVAGFLSYRHLADLGSWWVTLAYTMPAYRRKGVHNTLFQALVLRAKSRGDILSIENGTNANNIIAQRAFEKQKREISYISYTYVVRPFEKAKVPFSLDMLAPEQKQPAPKAAEEKEDVNGEE